MTVFLFCLRNKMIQKQTKSFLGVSMLNILYVLQDRKAQISESHLTF